MSEEYENFDDYNASEITPQYTLLKKFNKILDWLKGTKKDTQQMYKHHITFTYVDASFAFEFYDEHKERYTKADLAKIIFPGRVGNYYHSVEGFSTCSFSCQTSVGTWGYFVYFNGMSTSVERGSIVFANVTNFIDKE